LSKYLFNSETVIPAWKIALTKKNDKPLIFHIDRVIQITMFDYLDGTRKGNCWDNAVAERLFKTLIPELIYD